ncbi:MAG: Phosphoenolpyruvate carboxykinase [ATP] [uncultured Thermomicrobiales bacterium]|uniref:Phosphoenolpyruvate carboxykinase [ATP] n=1 Tax=uncultured Thermomicrobiales bacterium TaxID=1645740 RepID=A0A6J4U1U7_9BACT|nr:MAG: Phosphoenolpyruvate carboxykinase [ATP] [uncultured Thermomicrobiales bacterium]
MIALSAAAEPGIHTATNRLGTVLENVVLDPATAEPVFADDSLTENTRAAFPLAAIPGSSPTGTGSHPRHVLFLTADAFGILPPVARLTPEQAISYFQSSYTSQLAGTERGITEPEATFSACFGAPLLALPPIHYAEMLGDRLARHTPAVWLINTGWSGGPVSAGQRMPIGSTRAIVRSLVEGRLEDVPTVADDVFRLAVPTACPGVPPELLVPRETWVDSDAHDAAARRLANAFAENFRSFAGSGGAGRGGGGSRDRLSGPFATGPERSAARSPTASVRFAGWALGWPGPRLPFGR